MFGFNPQYLLQHYIAALFIFGYFNHLNFLFGRKSYN